ncbi:hypothetical protein LIA77_05891 [Sarocladium implicatum]|nr:hypothetical protein LIA77_05891 [Sarocladium implicatum]
MRRSRRLWLECSTRWEGQPAMSSRIEGSIPGMICDVKEAAVKHSPNRLSLGANSSSSIREVKSAGSSIKPDCESRKTSKDGMSWHQSRCSLACFSPVLHARIRSNAADQNWQLIVSTAGWRRGWEGNLEGEKDPAEATTGHSSKARGKRTGQTCIVPYSSRVASPWRSRRLEMDPLTNHSIPTSGRDAHALHVLSARAASYHPHRQRSTSSRADSSAPLQVSTSRA